MNSFFVILFCVLSFIGDAKNIEHNIDSLISQVNQSNEQSEYKKSIELMQKILDNDQVTNQEKYQIYILYSYVYKKLYDYNTVFYYLNLAKNFGQKTTDSLKNENNIDCEIAIANFDIRQYDTARVIMNRLEALNYLGLTNENIAYMNMQQAYLLFLDKKYTNAELKYKFTLSLFEKFLPRHTSNIYVKMMQLYDKMGEEIKCNEMYQKAILRADQAKILKYKLYAKQEYFTILVSNHKYEQAIKVNFEIDKVEEQYNKNKHLLEVEKIESDYRLKLKEIELNSYKRNLMIWIGFSLLLLTSIFFIVYLYRKLSLRKKEVDIQNALNERLTSIISHDIRESLLSTNLLLKKLDTKDKYLDEIKLSIENQIININQILENILSVKRGSRNIQNTSEIIDCLNFCINALSEQLKDKKIQIQKSIPSNTLIQYPLNKEKLKIVLFNIFSNAIKYSYKDSIISVYFQDNFIYIRDFGIGIHPELKSKIFSDTVNSELGTNLESGNGIGLFFANSIIKDTKARISIESPIDGGTLVKIG